MSRRLGILLAALGLALADPAHAVEPQYRKVKLIDGRTLLVEILETEAQGLRVRVPQGEMLLSFELLLDMVPITLPEYDEQPPWVVYYDAPPELRDETVELLAAIPRLQLQPVNEPGNGVDSKTAFTAAACNRDVECVAVAVANTSWKWVLTESSAETGGVAVRAKLNTSTDRASEVVVDGTGRTELWNALHTSLGLDVPSSPPPRPITTGPEPSAPMTSNKVVALSFVPLPGLPSLAQKDGGGALVALGVVIPSTAVWISAVGSSGQNPAEVGILSAAGFYGLTVLANQVTGLRSLEHRKLEVGALPTDHGGGAVVVGGRL